MMYVLARTIPMPMASATSHNCSFMLRGDNGQRTRSFEDLSDGDSDGSHGDESSGV